MRAALYARVSTEEQTEGYSLDAQITCCREHCEAQGWQVVSEYLDPAFSGRSVQRPGFQQMMEDARAGLFDILLVHKLDRFSRSLRDTIVYLGHLAEVGVGVLSLQERFDYTTPSGRLLMHMLAALAQWYSENLGQEIQKGLAQRAREGLWLGDLATGYCRGLCSQCDDKVCPRVGQEDRGNGRPPILHPIDSKGVLLAFETYATGRHTLESLASFLSARGFQTCSKRGRRPWTRSALSETLKNPFYIGFIRHKGHLLPGNHEPLISEELWRKCEQARRLHSTGPRTYSPKHRTYLFGGLLRCVACGGRMNADASEGGYRYYRCIAHQRQIECWAPQSRVREDVLSEQMTGIISRLVLPGDWCERVLALLQDGDDVERIRAERARLEEKLRRLHQAWIEVEIDEGYYRTEKAKAESRLASLVVPDGVVKIEEAANYLKDLSLAWDVASREERRAILGFIFEAIYCDPAYKRLVAVQPKDDFLSLFSEMSILKEKGRKFEIIYDQVSSAGISAPDRRRTVR